MYQYVLILRMYSVDVIGQFYATIIYMYNNTAEPPIDLNSIGSGPIQQSNKQSVLWWVTCGTQKHRIVGMPYQQVMLINERTSMMASRKIVSWSVAMCCCYIQPLQLSLCLDLWQKFYLSLHTNCKNKRKAKHTAFLCFFTLVLQNKKYMHSYCKYGK